MEAIGGGRPCDVMIDTGMNRLGLRAGRDRRARWPGHRHAAQPSRLRGRGSARSTRCNCSAFARWRRRFRPRRYSLANRRGICLGGDYSFDLVRPGLALYGGIPRERGGGPYRAGRACRGARWCSAADQGRRKLRLWRDLHRRRGHRGGDRQHRLCRRLFPRLFAARARPGRRSALPLLGRVSMDMLVVDASAAPELARGRLGRAGLQSGDRRRNQGMSQYELLTGLGSRFERIWR